MNLAAILALLGDLYQQIIALTAEVKRFTELSPDPQAEAKAWDAGYLAAKADATRGDNPHWVAQTSPEPVA